MPEEQKRIRVSAEEAAIIEELRARRKQEEAPVHSSEIEPGDEAAEPVDTGAKDEPTPPTVREMVEQMPNPAEVKVWTEEAQDLLDIKLVNEAIQRLRTVLAQTKLNRLLSLAGLLDEPKGKGTHPKQWLAALADQRKTLDFLVDLRMGMEAMIEPDTSGVEEDRTVDA